MDTSFSNARALHHSTPDTVSRQWTIDQINRAYQTQWEFVYTDTNVSRMRWRTYVCGCVVVLDE